MVKYVGGSGTEWYVGKRITAQTVGTESFHFYNAGVNNTVMGITSGGALTAIGSMYSPIFYDYNNSAYYVDPNSRSYMYTFTMGDSNELNQLTTNVTTSSIIGLGFNGSDSAYSIFKSAGAWVQPLNIKFYTGLRLYAAYNYDYGISFWDQVGGGLLFSVGQGDYNVRVSNSIFAQTFYDTNTSYYADPAGISNLAYVNLASVYVGNKNTAGAGALVNTSWQEVAGLVVSGVYIQYGFSRVICTFTISQRALQGGLSHGVFRIRAVSQNTGTTFYVGDPSWGFGITRIIDAGAGTSWNQYTQTVNLANFAVEGNSFVAGNTYSVYLEVRDANDNWYYVAGEADGSFRGYTPAQMQIWIS